MFEKLLANLPYNPSLINQMSFYGSRLRREQTVRRAGVVFMLFAFFIQFFAVMSPPQATVANSANDIVNNGFSSAAEAAQLCRTNAQGDFSTILSAYGISCDAVASASTVSLKSTDYNRNLYSLGRLAYGKAGEQPVNINGKTYFARYLWAWDSRAASTYKALKVQASNGQTQYILYDCGNLTTVGIPQPVAPAAPQPEIDKVQVTAVCNASRRGFNVSALLTAGYTYVWHVNGVEYAKYTATATGIDTRSFDFDAVNVPVGQQAVIKVINVQKAVGIGTETITNNCAQTPLPVTPVVTPEPMPKPAPAPVPKPTPPPATEPCVYDNTSSADRLACLQFRKAAANPTQKLPDANNTMANAGDTIVYSMYVANSGKDDYKDYVVTENISDVLDYADVVNLNGGTMDDNKNVVWPATTIKAGQEITKTVTVKVKAVIPQTPRSSSDPGHFDLLMTNVYGNTVNIKLPGATGKTIEAAAATLPVTGPGTSLMIAGAIMVAAGYFFARTRLLVVETKLAIQENANGGL